MIAVGGAKRDRTADLYNAIVALSQLSYSPVSSDLTIIGRMIQPIPYRATPACPIVYPSRHWPGKQKIPAPEGGLFVFLRDAGKDFILVIQVISNQTSTVIIIGIDVITLELDIHI